MVSGNKKDAALSSVEEITNNNQYIFFTEAYTANTVDIYTIAVDRLSIKLIRQ